MPMSYPDPESTPQSTEYQLQDIIALFDGLFAETFNTRLVRGGDEPLYVPAGNGCDWHQVIFARGFYTSALHEISHWCIAGERRRLLEDYGYWYIPDGRDAEQQHAFEKVEIAPQALELLFSRACGIRFNVSVDNLGEVDVDREVFEARVAERAMRYLSDGLPLRAAALELTLRAFYQQRLSLSDALTIGRGHLVVGMPMASREVPQPA
ncbi:elongation factor P hydroxylase [Halomonas huangheensis]|nr:elongation factor P hydroxylase [Halomonas huangheensis]